MLTGSRIDECEAATLEAAKVARRDLSTKERADAILAINHLSNMPHPDKPGMRIMGWVVPEDVAGLGVGILAIEEIQRRALATTV